MSLRREAVKSKTKYVHRIFDYRSKQRNNWFITVDYYVAKPAFTVVIYYLDKYGLNGNRVNANNQSLTHFTPHFLNRHNERFLKQENLSKVDLLKRFAQMNPLEVIMSVKIKTSPFKNFGRTCNLIEEVFTREKSTERKTYFCKPVV
jgi:hypothetical protein